MNINNEHEYEKAKKELEALVKSVEYDSMLLGYTIANPKVASLASAIREYEKRKESEKKSIIDEDSYDLSSYVMDGYTDWG